MQQEEQSYFALAAADLDRDGTEELVTLDSSQSRILEVLAREGTGFSEALHFTVFEADPHYQGRQGARAEPREMLFAEITGDDLPDLVLLVHDRLLVYPNASSPPAASP